MEEMVGTWNYTRSSILQGKTRLIEIDTQLNKCDATSAWKRLALGLCTPGKYEGGSGSVTGAPMKSFNMRSIPVTPLLSTVPFPIPSTIT